MKPSVPSELWVGLCQVSSFTNVLNQLSSGNVKKTNPKQNNIFLKETVQTKTGENTSSHVNLLILRFVDDWIMLGNQLCLERNAIECHCLYPFKLQKSSPI